MEPELFFTAFIADAQVTLAQVTHCWSCPGVTVTQGHSGVMQPLPSACKLPSSS